MTITANPKMVCYYRSYCLDLPVVLVDCQMKGCELRLYHICQGGYVAMHVIDLDGAERNICHNFVDELWMGGKPKKLKMVQHSTVYRTDESEKDKKEVEETVYFNGGDEVNIVPFVYPRGTASVSSLGCFSSVGYYYKPSHPSLPLSFLEHATLKSILRRRGGENENSLSHSRRRPCMRSG